MAKKSWCYEIVIDYYAGPVRRECRTKKEVKPLIFKMLQSISGGTSGPIIYKHTTENVTDEFVTRR